MAKQKKTVKSKVSARKKPAARKKSMAKAKAGLVVTRRILSALQVGLEVYHQTPDERGAQHATGIGAGVVYDVSEHYHLLAFAGSGVQNRDAANQASWYAALLFTY